MYLPGPHRGIFNWEALRVSKSIILCEALIDALTSWCHGFRNVISVYGVESPIAEHLAAFKRYGTTQALIAFDRDEAGKRPERSGGTHRRACAFLDREVSRRGTAQGSGGARRGGCCLSRILEAASCRTR
jgi:hypothetical protein